MGLFSSSYKYYAYAATSDLFERKPSTLQDTIIQASIGNESISGAVQFALMTDLGARAKAAIKYAIKEYVRGLPESNQTLLYVDQQLVQSVLEAGIREAIAEFYWFFAGKANEDFFIAKTISEVYNDPAYFPWPQGAPDNPYWEETNEFVEIPVVDPVTNKYYITENAPVINRDGYANSLTYDDIQDLTGDQYSRLPFADLFEGKYRVGFNYTDHLNQPQYWEVPQQIDLSAYTQGNWLQVKYHTESEPDITKYWIYLAGSGHPALDASITEGEVKGSYMPVAIMMQDQVWFDEDPDSELYITTKKLLKKFAMKGDKIKEDYLEQKAEDDASGDKNKSNAEAWDFFIHFAVPIQAKSRGSLEYLYYFFLEMEKSQLHTFEEYQTYLGSRLDKRNGYGLPQPVTELEITEAGVNGYNVKYGWSYIYSETFPGRFKELRPKHLDSELYQRKEFNDVEYRVGVEYMHGGGILIGRYRDQEKEKTLKNGYHDYAIFTYQHYDEDTDTWSHTRVLVMGLSMLYTINTRNVEGKSYRFRYADINMIDYNENGQTKEFRIPIHIGILKDMVPRVHHEQLIADSAAVTIFLVEAIKVKWYQTGFFKWLIIIIAVVLIILSIVFPPFLLVATSLIVGTTGGLFFIMVYMVLSFVVGFIISLAGSLIGGTAGLIFTIVGMVAMMGSGGNTWSLTNAFPGFGSWGAAATTIGSTAAVAAMGVSIYSTYSLSKLEADLRDFTKNAKEKWEELQDAWDALGPMPYGIDPLSLMRALDIGRAEKADEYYIRVLNFNPGITAYSFVNDYTEIALYLPEDISDNNIVDSQMESFATQRGTT